MIPTPPPADDELVSAYLDGEVSAAERARVEGDPTLLARVDQLRAAADVVASPVAPLDEVTRRRLIDGALATASLDAVDAAAAVSAPPPAAVELSTRRRRPAAWIGAAAAAVSALVLVSVLPGGGDGDVALRDDSVTVLEAAPNADATADAEASVGADAAPEALEESADGAVGDTVGDTPESDGSDVAGGAGEVGDEATAAATVDLGPLPDVEAVVARARSAADDAAPASPAASACAVRPRAETLVLDALAEVDGTAYLVRVWSDGEGGGDIEVVDAVDCAVVLSADR